MIYIKTNASICQKKQIVSIEAFNNFVCYWFWTAIRFRYWSWVEVMAKFDFLVVLLPSSMLNLTLMKVCNRFSSFRSALISVKLTCAYTSQFVALFINTYEIFQCIPLNEQTYHAYTQLQLPIDYIILNVDDVKLQYYVIQI